MKKKSIFSIIIALIINTFSFFGQDVDAFMQDYLTAMQTQDIAEFYRAVRRIEKFLDENTEEGTDDYYLVSTYLASAYAVRENYEKAFPLLQQSYEYFSKKRETPEIISIKETICNSLATCYSEFKEDYAASLSLLLEMERYSKSNINRQYGPYGYVSLMYRVSQVAVRCNNLDLANKYIKKSENLFAKYEENIVGSIGQDETEILREVIYGTHISVLNALMVNSARRNRTKPLLKYLDTAIEISNQHKISTYPLQEGLLFAIDALAEKGEDKSVQDIILRYVQDIHKFSSDSGEKLTDDDIVRMVGGLFLQPADSLGLDAAARCISNIGYDLSGESGVSAYLKFCTIQYKIKYSNKPEWSEITCNLVDLIKHVENSEIDSNDTLLLDAYEYALNRCAYFTLFLRYHFKEEHDNIPIFGENDSKTFIQLFSTLSDGFIQRFGRERYLSMMEKNMPGVTSSSAPFILGSKNDISVLFANCAAYFDRFDEYRQLIKSLSVEGDLTCNEISDIIVSTATAMTLYYSYQKAYRFFQYMKDILPSEAAELVLERIEHWVDSNEQIANNFALEGDKESCLAKYDETLYAIEMTEGIGLSYVKCLYYKASNLLHELNDPLEAIECLNELFSKISAQDNIPFNVHYGVLRCLQIAYSRTKDYAKERDFGEMCLQYLMDHPECDNYYDYSTSYFSTAFDLVLAYAYSGDSVSANNLLSKIRDYAISIDYWGEVEEIYNAHFVELRKKNITDLVNSGNVLRADKELDSLIGFISDKPSVIILKSIADSNLEKSVLAIGKLDKFLNFYSNLLKSNQFTREERKELQLCFDFISLSEQTVLHNYPRAIESKYKSLKNLLSYTNPSDSLCAVEFSNLRSLHEISIATSIQYNLADVYDDYHPHHSYEMTKHMIERWRDILLDLQSRTSKDIIAFYNEVHYNRHVHFWADSDVILDPISFSFLEECRLEANSNHLEAFYECLGQYINSLKTENSSEWYNYYKWDILYNTAFNLSNQLEAHGLVSQSIELVQSAIDQTFDWWGNLSDNEYGSALKCQDQLTTQLCYIMSRAGYGDSCYPLLHKIRLLVDEEYSISEYNALSADNPDLSYEEFKAWYPEPFYNVNTMIDHLTMAIRCCPNDAIRKKFIDFSESLLATYDSSKTPIDSTNVSRLFNDIACQMGTIEGQIKYFEKAISYQPSDYVQLINLAYIYSFAERYKESEGLIQKCEKLIEQEAYIVPRFHILLLETKANNAIGLGEYDKIQELLKEMFRISKSDYLNMTNSLNTEMRVRYFDLHMTGEFEHITKTEHMAGNDASVSYDAALFHKGLLNNQQRTIRNCIMTSSDSILKDLNEKYQNSIMEGSDSTAMYDHQMMLRYAKHPEFVGAFQTSTWHDVQEQLGSNDIAIEYSLITKEDEDYLAAMILKKKSKNPEFVELCSISELERLIYKTQDKNGYPRAYTEKTEKGNYKLYELIWEPLGRYLKGVRSIYFAPYSLINRINIEWLRKNDSSKYIAERFIIKRVSSTNEISLIEDDNYNHISLFGALDYNFQKNDLVDDCNIDIDDVYSEMRGCHEHWGDLEETKIEIDDIYHMFCSRASIDMYTGPEGTESSFKKMSGNAPEIIHVATHGYYYSQNSTDLKKIRFFNPEENDEINVSTLQRSGLIFAGANKAWKNGSNTTGNDGILTSSEIEGMDLHQTNLLVLSACQTALGDEFKGAIFGLQRSFKIAGVKTIIMSLWEVNSSKTQEMMTCFYSNLSKGMNKHAAFMNAVVVMKHQYPDEPNMWAPFVMLD